MIARLALLTLALGTVAATPHPEAPAPGEAFAPPGRSIAPDAQVAYHAASSCDATVFRRNHAYFWYPDSNATNPPAAFRIAQTNTTAALELNSIEGIHGVHDRNIQDLKTPEGVKRLPE